MNADLEREIRMLGKYHDSVPEWLCIHKCWAAHLPYMRKMGFEKNENTRKSYKKSIIRIVATGELKEFESRADMCEFMEIVPQSLWHYQKHAIDGVITIREKEYDILT